MLSALARAKSFARKRNPLAPHAQRWRRERAHSAQAGFDASAKRRVRRPRRWQTCTRPIAAPVGLSGARLNGRSCAREYVFLVITYTNSTRALAVVIFFKVQERVKKVNFVGP